ncbi:cupin domain-containing protein [Micromonospora craterilacus]|nr:cupin domain-containing protein [Micromonospora craterilacus]
MARIRSEIETPVAHSDGLEWLLHPITPADFLHTAWEQQPLLISRAQRDYFQDLPGLDEVDEMITTTMSGRRIVEDDASRLVRTDDKGRISQRDFRITRAGVPDIQDIYQAYHEGHTIVLNGIHRRSSKVANLSRALEATLHHPVGVNLYLTPRHSQGFDLHVDDHDVFILQLHGTKVWHVASGLSPATEHGKRPLSDIELRTMTLESGDSLYIPRGFPHRAQATATSSLHLTVGVHAFRWADLMTEALRLLADDDAEFRSALPPGFLDREIDPENVARLGNQLAHALTDESLARRARQSLGARLIGAGKAAPGGHFRSLDRLARLSDDSLVRRTRTMYHRIRSGPADVAIEFDGNFVSGPPFLEDALRFIADHELFRVDELPEIGNFHSKAKTDLVSRLIREGFLAVADEAPEGNHAT